MIVTREDTSALGYCSRGCRDVLTRHRVNWIEFATKGVDIEVLRVIQDPMVQRVVAQAEKRHGR